MCCTGPDVMMCWFAFRNRWESVLARSGQVHDGAVRPATFDIQGKRARSAEIDLPTKRVTHDAMRQTSALSPERTRNQAVGTRRASETQSQSTLNSS